MSITAKKRVKVHEAELNAVQDGQKQKIEALEKSEKEVFLYRRSACHVPLPDFGR